VASALHQPSQPGPVLGQFVEEMEELTMNHGDFIDFNGIESGYHGIYNII